MTNSARTCSHPLRWASFLLCFILIGLPNVWAQSFYGSVVGTVADSTGAVIPGAEITLTNIGTNTQQKATTDTNGSYQVLNLLPGHYRLEVRKAGFERLLRPDVEVSVQSAVRIDAPMKIGQETETVEVSTQTPLLDTEDATISQVIEGRTVQDMPISGRNVANLIELAPGVVPQANSAGSAITNGNSGTGTTPTGWSNYQIGGGMSNQSYASLDGATLNGQTGGAMAIVPTQDSVAEFRVSANNVPAEFGRTSGGVINATTKSGTNSYHGSIYEYLKNTDFNANAFFNNRAGIPRPEYNQSQYGAFLSGPIIKNKLFAFLGTEDQQLHLQGPSVFSVPTAAELTGDFSASNIPVIYDPTTVCSTAANPNPGYAACNVVGGAPVYTRQAFPGNKIPASRIDPVANIAKNFFAPPNTNGNSLTNNYAVNQLIKANQNQQNLRLDDTISDKQRVFLHYTYYRGNQSPGQPFFKPTTGTYNTFYNHDVVLGDTYVINPTTIADVRVSYLRFQNQTIGSSIGQPLSQFGPGWASLANQVNQQAYMGFAIQGLFSFGNIQGNIHNTLDTYSVGGSLTKILGRHSLKMGITSWRQDWFSFNSTQAVGQFSFDSNYTSQTAPGSSGTGIGMASFLLGYPASGSATEVKPVSQFEYYNALYLQDSFKATNKLTVVYGLRWDLSPGEWQEKHNSISTFLPNTTDPLGAAVTSPYFTQALHGIVVPVGSAAYAGTSLHPSSRKLFAPRFGATYLLTPNSVVRGGYSIIYTPTNASTLDAPVSTNANSALTNMVATYNGGITPAGYLPPAGSAAVSFSNPFPTGLIQVPGRSAAALSAADEGTSITNPVANQPFPYMQQWNLDLEDQSFHGILVGIAYVGAKGTHLAINGNRQLNQLDDKYDSLGQTLLTKVANPFYGVLPLTAGALASSPTILEGQLLRPFPQYQSVISTGDYSGGSSYNSLQVRAQKRWGKAGTLGGNYSWSKLISNTDSLGNGGGAPGTVQDWDNLAGARSLASFDVNHRAVINYVLSLPFGRGRKYLGNISRWQDQVLGGWSLNGVTTFQSGFPLVFTSTNTQLATNFGAGTPEPNIVPGCNIRISGSAVSRLNQWFNTACFTAPSQYGFGNAGRTLGIRAEGIDNFDFALGKIFSITESVKFEFRAEAFNMFNRVQFNPPGTQVGASTFGITSSSVASQANSPRNLQLAARISF